MDLDKDIIRIKSKIENLIKLDTDFSVLDNYDMDKALSEKEISDFEEKYNLELPIEYRKFIQHISAGKFGPFYGLLSLYDNDEHTPNLSLDFPYTEDKVLNLYKELEILGYFEEKDMTEEEVLYSDKIDSTIDDLYTSALQGVKFICDEGCGMYSILILRGEAKGQVWFFDFANDVGCFPLKNPTSKKVLNFLEWYEIWLDRSLSSILNDTGDEYFTYSEYIIN